MKFTMSIFILILGFLNNAFTNDLISEADKLYELRSVGFNPETLLANSTNIDKAIAFYKRAVENKTGSDKEEALWKLLQSYYFKARYTTPDRNTQKAIYDIGKELGVQGFEEFPESARIHLWVGILWGSWGEAHGAFKAARKGVAQEVRKHAKRAIELDATFDGGAGYRLLGALHLKAPRIPLILGWPSKKKAVELLEKAYTIDSENLFNRKLLAEALYERNQVERALQLMQELLDADTAVVGLLEGTVFKREVELTLNRWKTEE